MGALLRLVLAAALSASVTAAAVQTPATPTGRHFVWRVATGQRAVAWLVGSVHVLNRDAYPLPAIYERAFDESHTVVQEIDLGAASDPALVLPMASKAMLNDGSTLSGLVGRETAALVAEKAGAAGLPMSIVDRMKPWLAAMTLTVPALQRAGFDPALGLDRHFYDRAKAAQRPVRGLETAASQIAALDGLPMTAQVEMLKAVLADVDAQVEGVSEIVSAWRRGDVATLETRLLEEFRSSPVVYQRLLVDRNRAWIPQIARCRVDSAPCFVVVGGAHLVGPDSVVAMLRDAGFSVEQQ